ncbi:protein RNA-directed DNA methylation 3-like [Malania oleifera]|uniref:protein RNA-directed DNA methylation 3-like n=1 Tax=Malania oleifera TaxID=397392 RepID=UPI0025AEA59E|nr:protein RNA-directed DNA methylation 3-like [Malania oleifera]
MGNWRGRQSRNYKRDAQRSHYAELPPPIPTSGYWQNSVPSWEKKFCTSVGSIPWRKVVDTKKFMHYYSNVLSWNDSAGEEAFCNAKQRFWADINGLSCDISLPDRDIYIDEIDWNPYIDPELILDLDREYVSPDDVEMGTRKKTKSFSGCVSEGYNRDSENGANPWECNYIEGSGALKDQDGGWGKWDNFISESKDLHSDNQPREQSHTRGTGTMKDNPWVCANQSKDFNNGNNPWESGGQDGVKDKGWNDFSGDSRGLKHWGNNIIESRNLYSSNSNSWGHGCQGSVLVKNKRWGDFSGDSWGLKGWGNNISEFRNVCNSSNPWECDIPNNGGSKDSGWKVHGENCDGWNKWESNHINDPKNLESRRTGGWGAWNGGCRKREGSHQYMQRYKSSRFQGDDQQAGNGWRKARANKRVTFSFE